MTTLRDVFLPGVPRNLFGWFLEHPSAPRLIQSAAPLDAPAGGPPVAPPAGPPAYSDGLVEPGDLDGFNDFATPGEGSMFGMGDFAPFAGLLPKHTNVPGWVERPMPLRRQNIEPDLLSSTTPTDPFSEAIEHHDLVRDHDGDCDDGGHTLASWLAGIRDQLRSRPWFRILCELRLMAFEGRREKQLATEAAAAKFVAPMTTGQVEVALAQAMRELAAALRVYQSGPQYVIHRQEPSFYRDYAPPPPPRYAPPPFVPAYPAYPAPTPPFAPQAAAPASAVVAPTFVPPQAPVEKKPEAPPVFEPAKEAEKAAQPVCQPAPAFVPAPTPPPPTAQTAAPPPPAPPSLREPTPEERREMAELLDDPELANGPTMLVEDLLGPPEKASEILDGPPAPKTEPPRA